MPEDQLFIQKNGKLCLAIPGEDGKWGHIDTITLLKGTFRYFGDNRTAEGHNIQAVNTRILSDIQVTRGAIGAVVLSDPVGPMNSVEYRIIKDLKRNVTLFRLVVGLYHTVDPNSPDLKIDPLDSHSPFDYALLSPTIPACRGSLELVLDDIELSIDNNRPTAVAALVTKPNTVKDVMLYYCLLRNANLKN